MSIISSQQPHTHHNGQHKHQQQHTKSFQGLLAKPLEHVIVSLNQPLHTTIELAFLQLKHTCSKKCMFQKQKIGFEKALFLHAIFIKICISIKIV